MQWLTAPGKDHTSHRIAAHGFSQREAVLILYPVCAALGIAALLVSVAEEIAAYILGAATLSLAAYLLWFMELGPWKLRTPTEEQMNVSRSLV